MNDSPEFPNIPPVPGIKAVGYVNMSDLNALLCMALIIGHCPKLPAPRWLSLDSIPVLSLSSSPQDSANVNLSELSFSTSDPVPTNGVAWVCRMSDGSARILGYNHEHPGTMKSESTTSRPGEQPATSSYTFSFPGSPAACAIQES